MLKYAVRVALLTRWSQRPTAVTDSPVLQHLLQPTRRQLHHPRKPQSPLNALLGKVRRSAGVVAWLEARVGNLTEDGNGEQLLDMTMFGPKVSVWIKTFQDERAQLARVCKMAIDSGVQQELLDIMKQNGRTLGEFVADVLHDQRLALTPVAPDRRPGFRSTWPA